MSDEMHPLNAECRERFADNGSQAFGTGTSPLIDSTICRRNITRR